MVNEMDITDTPTVTNKEVNQLPLRDDLVSIKLFFSRRTTG